MSSDEASDSEFFESNIDEHQHQPLEKRSWIYNLNKSELQKKLKELGVEFQLNDKVDDLRKLLRNYCKQRQVLTKMSNYNIQPFDGKSWECFEQQMECIITLNEVPEEKKVPLLLTKVTPAVLEVLNYLCTPNKPMKLNYADLCALLREKYTPKKSIILERAAFRSRNQLPNETIDEYVLQLRKLGGKCKFKDLEDQIKEKLIDGVHSRLIKFELLKNSYDISLEETIVLARTVEAALIQTNDINKDSKVSEMFFYGQKKKTEERKPFLGGRNRFNNKGSRANFNNKELKCYCCGGNNHFKTECRLKQKYCSECGQQGHIYKMCPKNKGSSQMFMVESNEGTDNAEEDEPSVASLFDDCKTYSVNKQKNM